MPKYQNPFEFEQATQLSPEFVKDVFIEDYNFTRFIQSTRNIILSGERGSGKSMTLIYNSVAVQGLGSLAAEEALDLSHIGIYIPCNTPLTHRKDYELLPDPSVAAVVSEHFMVLSIVYAIAEGLTRLPVDFSGANGNRLREELGYVLGIDLAGDDNVLQALMLYVERSSGETQKRLNALALDDLRQAPYTFGSLVSPVLRSFRRISALRDSHFLLLIDDAHDLNDYQKATLNSWLAFRDRSSFSFKVAVADSENYDYRTASGGSILEGHDFLTIDLQKPFQSAGSTFGKLARDIVERRLRLIGVQKSADEFFPESTDFADKIEECRVQAAREAEKIYPKESDSKKRRDFVYKYARVRYFRERAAQANLPIYSGFETIAHVSTGVVRNLLRPCYWMYDAVYSEKKQEVRVDSIEVIPPERQSEVLRTLSEDWWQWLESGLSSAIDGCTDEDGKRVRNLLDNLGVLFRARLLNAKSEPRAIQFSISGMSPEYEENIMRILNIARRAQLIYVRSGPAKAKGRREPFYVPNRLLWPIRGLDVVGQHARVSLKAEDIWAAANGREFPFAAEAEETAQREMFHD